MQCVGVLLHVAHIGFGDYEQCSVRFERWIIPQALHHDMSASNFLKHMDCDLSSREIIPIPGWSEQEPPWEFLIDR